MAPKTPNKNKNNNGSPGKFVKPADLFKMRRLNATKTTLTLTPANHSNSSNPGANISFHLHSSPLGGFSQPKLPPPPVPSSPNFKKISAAHHIEPPSPLKCLSNLTEPSPTKNLPTILKNPFDKPAAKRKLCLSPKKAIKRSKMLALDEDANLEAPKTKLAASPNKSNNANKSCSRNDWTLKTKMKIRFDSFCKNWNENPSTTHQRFPVDQQSSDSSCSTSSTTASCSQLAQPSSDNTVSLEALKNVGTIYQHPYLSWLPLYPRTVTGFYKKDSSTFIDFIKSPQIASSMKNDWCDSIDDVTNLLIEGRCPYFYLCADNFNILFKQRETDSPVQACISPFTFGMASHFNNLKIGYRYPSQESSYTETDRENSQNTFSSIQSTRQTPANNTTNTSPLRMAKSIDSGHCSDLSDEEDDAVHHDTSQILDDIGLSENDLEKGIISKTKGFAAETATSNTQSSSQMPLAIVEGVDNLKKLIKFLKTNRTYTINNLGRFAHLPPTILAPNQFRFSTPQVPDILMSQNVMERLRKSPSKRRPIQQQQQHQQVSANSDSISNENASFGPAYIEITGAILPKVHRELHNLLVQSKNEDHKCHAATLESSAPFSRIKF